jgi:amino acid transporter
MIITFIGWWLLAQIGFFSFIIAFVVGPLAGDLLVRISDRLTHNKKGRAMQLAVAGCYVLGALPWTLLTALAGALSLPLILFTIIAATTAVARVR